VRRQAGRGVRLRTRAARSATRRSGGWQVQEFSNEIVCGIEYALDLAGHGSTKRGKIERKKRRNEDGLEDGCPGSFKASMEVGRSHPRQRQG
jgi:hypothetical protein